MCLWVGVGRICNLFLKEEFFGNLFTYMAGTCVGVFTLDGCLYFRRTERNGNKPQMNTHHQAKVYKDRCSV